MGEMSDTHAIVRALRVMEVLNQRSVTSVEKIYKDTGISKPTIVRILSTLVNAGYVFHISRRDGYTLTEKILRLSAGFKYSDAIVDVARPLLEEFTRRHKWQVSLATRDFDAMRFRYNTRHLSPFAPDQRLLNRRVHMLVSAVGRAYLAYCAEAEREVIMASLQGHNVERFIEGEAESVEALLEAIRAKRYATQERPGTVRGRSFRSFAIPLVSAESGSALAAMVMFYYASAMTEPEAIGKYLDELYGIAARITSALDGTHGTTETTGPCDRPSEDAPGAPGVPADSEGR
jgi:IclR family transcriptional regulator, mhp operon transcriptional activator